MKLATFVTLAACLSAGMLIAEEAAKPSAEKPVATAATAPAEPIVPKEKTMLFNGKDFAGWKMFIPDAKVDPNTVWSIKDGAIRCEGKPSGYVRTEADYANYKLHVEWRWAAGKGSNSGVLIHMTGKDAVWPKSIECQGMSGNAGDIWVIGGTDFKEHTDKANRRVPKKGASAEKPLGEWNTYEIVCKGDTLKLYVNGELKNEATEATEKCGKICLQSEGGVIEFRNIYVEPADAKVEPATAPKDK